MKLKSSNFRFGAYGKLWLNNRNLPSAPDIDWDNPLLETHILKGSQGNQFEKLGKTLEQIGGDFLVFHSQVNSDVTTPLFYSRDWAGAQWGTSRYRGHLCASRLGEILVPVDTTSWWPTFNDSDSYQPFKTSGVSSLNVWGTSAIAAVEPTNPLSGLSVAIGELKKDGLPSLPGIRALQGKTSSARSAGSEYLNKEFGWDPLISDVRKFMHVQANQNKLIEQYARGSGRKIRRELRLPSEIDTTYQEGVGLGYLYPPLGSNFYHSLPKWSRRITTSKKKWFVGSFTYFLPPYKVSGSNFERNRRLAHKLYGASITPETVWDLTPWSWAVDWVSNTGDVLHNIGAFADNGLVMHYGYVMEEISTRVETRVWDIEMQSAVRDPSPTRPRKMSCSSDLVSTTKRRIVASPYGFGLNWDGFSSFQLSILAALGISRGRR